MGGDFNIISNSNENIGGSPPNFNVEEDFINMILDCGFVDICFTGSNYTCYNNRV